MVEYFSFWTNSTLFCPLVTGTEVLGYDDCYDSGTCPHDLDFDEAGSQWLTEAGTYTFCIGTSSRDIAATAQLKIAEYTEKTTNALAPKQKLNLLKQ